MKIYFIEKEKFLRDAVEKMCKREDVEVYTDDNCENSTYLISDFAPTLLVIDQNTVTGHMDKVIESLSDEKIAQIPVVVLLSSGDNLESLLEGRVKKVMTKPLVAETLLDDLAEVLK